jgi:two-component system cell cycle sensor histidine kinase PleC
VIVGALGLGMYLRSVANEHLLKRHVEQTNLTLANLFIGNVWRENQAIVDSIQANGFANWQSNLPFIDFAKQAIEFCKNIPIIKLNLYDKNKNKFLSSSDFTIISDTTQAMGESNLQEIRTVQGGSISTKFLPKAAYKKPDGITQQAVLVRSIVPIYSIAIDAPAGGNNIEGVIEMFMDVSKEWEYVGYIQILGTSLIIIIFTIFYIILFFSAGRAQKIIEKQHEANVELLEAKQKAETESLEKSKFLANISHELRTPLNAIIGFSELIKTEAYGPVGSPQYKDYANDINNSGNHLLSLINDILDYSKAAADKLQVEFVDVDLTKTIITSMRLVKPRAEEAKVNLVEEVPQERIVFVADPKRLKQALLNLLSNAVKFTPEGGSVTLSAWVEQAENKIIIKVKDTGIGIAEQDISKAMSSFGQVDSKLSRRYEGTGLGLPLTKKLVELMGGNFGLQSEVGFGTTVTLTFPYKAASTEEKSGAESVMVNNTQTSEVVVTQPPASQAEVPLVETAPAQPTPSAITSVPQQEKEIKQATINEASSVSTVTEPITLKKINTEGGLEWKPGGN